MLKCLNEDVILKKGSIKAPKISEGQLKDIIKRKYGTTEIYELYRDLLEDCQKDFNISILTNNRHWTTEDSLDDAVYTLSNGVPILKLFLVDESTWACFVAVFYWDGKKMRGYIPTHGNTINLDFNCFLREELEFYLIDESSGKVYSNSKHPIYPVFDLKATDALKEYMKIGLSTTSYKLLTKTYEENEVIPYFYAKKYNLAPVTITDDDLVAEVLLNEEAIIEELETVFKAI